MATTNLPKTNHNELDAEQLSTKLQTLQGYLEQQRLLHDMSLLLSEEEDLDAFYRQVIKLARTELGFDRLGLFLLNESQTAVSGTYGIDPSGTLREEKDIVINLDDDNELPEFISSKERILVKEDVELFDKNEIAGRGWQIIVSVWQESRLLGVIFADNLFTQKPMRPFEPQILSGYADTIATLISRMRSEEALRHSEKALQVALEKQNNLHEINLELAGIDDLDKLTKQVIIQGREKLGFDRLGLWLIDDANETLKGTYGIGPNGKVRSEKDDSFIIENEPWIQDFVYDRERLIVREDDDLFEGDQGNQIIGRGWHIIAALWIHGTPIGLFFADNFLSQEPLQPHQPELLSAYGANVATFINRIKTEETLKESELSMQTFLEKMQELHEIGLQLSIIDNEKEMLWEAFELARTKLGFSRLGLFLVDPSHEYVKGTVGIDINGQIRDEFHIIHQLKDEPWMHEFLFGKERLSVSEDTDLHEDDRVVGRGWNIMTALWAENEPLGLLFTDNLLSKEPLQPYHPELLSAFGGTIADLINRNRVELERQSAQAAIAKQAADLQTVSDLSTQISSIQDPQALMAAIVEETKARFDLYHAHIYILDESGKNLVLAAGAGGVGAMMVKEGRFIPLSHSNSLVARAARTKKGVVVNNVMMDLEFLPNPLLPDTRSEMAVPLTIGNQVLGVIDVQADVTERFLSEDVQIQMTLAAQTAVALQNARQYEQTQQALANATTFRQLVAASSQGIGITSLSRSETIYVNSVLAKLYNISDPEKDLYGKSLGDYLPEDVRIRYQDEIIPAIMAHGSWEGELWLGDAEDPTITFENHFLLRDDAGNPTYAAAIVSDITERKAAEEAIAKQASDLQTVAELSTQITSIQDPQVMMEAVVEKSKERFDLYHAHIYLFDESGKNLVLTAGAGDVGKIMVKQGYSIPLHHENSLVASAARTKKGVVVNNVVMDHNYLPNPLLADTRSEMAVPMISGNEVLGVLDVQADTTDRFTNEDVQIQMTLAAQTAVALQNARQYEQTQQALANANTFRQLANASSQGIAITSLQGETIYVNSALSNLLNIADPETELYGKALGEFYPDEIQNSYLEEIIPTVMEHDSWEGELWLGDAEHPTFTYENHFLLRDEAGNPTYAAAIISDITERKAAEEEIRVNRNLMRTIIDISPDWIIVKSKENRYLLVNQAFSDYIGIPVDDMIGNDDIEIGFDEELVRGNPEKGIPGFWPEDQMVMDSGEVFQKDDMLEDFDQIRFNSTVKTPLRDEEGNVTGLVVFVHDITPQKTAENAMAKRAEELQAVAELSTAVAVTLDPQQLLEDVVDQAKERFELYHAHIYLLDDSGRNLVLTAGAGEAGDIMVKEGFSIPLNQEKSLVARAARAQKGVIVNDVMADPGFLANPLLPDTRSEMAVPMIAGDRVLGVLDVQSTQVEGFSSEDVQIQSTLAAQVAVALENARSLERSRKAVEELDALTRRLTRESWEEFLTDLEQDDTEFVYNLGELTKVDKTDKNEDDTETAVSTQNGHLSQSLMVHGEAIGHLTAFNEKETEQLGEDAALIMAAVAEQLSARVENIRLTDQTQQALAQTQNQAHRLGLLNEISAEMSNVETLNQVFEVIFARIPGLLNVDQVSMAMLQPDGETLEIIGHVGEAIDQPTGTRFPLADTPMAKALHDNRVIANNQPSSDNIIKSSMIAPIFSAGRAIGTLNIGSKKANALTNREETLLQQLATMLSSVIENKQLLAVAQARAERERQVRTITDKIRRGVDREAILNIAQQEISNLIGANKSAAQLGTKTQLLERIQQTIEQTQQESG